MLEELLAGKEGAEEAGQEARSLAEGSTKCRSIARNQPMDP